MSAQHPEGSKDPEKSKAPERAKTFKAPNGPLKAAWFGGILEGPVGPSESLRKAVAQIQALGFVRADLELERGRFSLMFDQTPIAGSRMDSEKSRRLVELLQDVVQESPKPEHIESTLHGSEVYSDQVVETLFAVRSGELECVSSQRAVNQGDLQRVQGASGDPPSLSLPRMSKPMLALCFGLFLLVGGLLTWRSGLWSQISAAQADSLRVETGSFGQLLQVEVDGSWGQYRIAISRGADYPSDPAAVTALESSATTTAQNRSDPMRVGRSEHLFATARQGGQGLGCQAHGTGRAVGKDRAPQGRAARSPSGQSLAPLHQFGPTQKMNSDSMDSDPEPSELGPEIGNNRGPANLSALRWPQANPPADGEGIDCDCPACFQPWYVHFSMAGFRLRCACGDWVSIPQAEVTESPANRAIAGQSLPAVRTIESELALRGEDALVPLDPAEPLRMEVPTRTQMPAGSLRHATRKTRQRWTDRAVAEMALIMLAFLGRSW